MRMTDYIRRIERERAANCALEGAALRIEDMLKGRDVWQSGEVLAIAAAIRACAAIVRSEKRVAD
jgi:hypothetical protein